MFLQTVIIHFVLLILLSFQSINAKLSVEGTSSFPHHIGKPYSIVLYVKGNLIPSEFPLLVIRDSNEKKVFSCKLNELFFNSAKLFPNNAYIRKINVNNAKRKIMLKIYFKKDAIKHSLELINSGTMRFYRQTIDLIISPKLSLTTKILTKSNNGYKVQIECISTGSIPIMHPKFKNLKDFKVVKQPQFYESTNKIVVILEMNNDSEFKRLFCWAGDVERYINLLPIDYPKTLLFSPDANVLRNDASINCNTIDGFPPPQINWQIINGPPDANKYIQFENDNTTVTLLTPPAGSLWQLQCNAVSTFGSSKKVLSKRIKFVVTEKFEKSQKALLEMAFNIKMASDNITNYLKQEVATLKKKLDTVSKMAAELPYKITNPPEMFVWEIKNLPEKRKVARSIFSDTFYSFGYTLKLRFDPVGFQSRDYISVYFLLAMSPKDELLAWPFNRNIKISLADINNKANDIVSYDYSYRKYPKFKVVFQRRRHAGLMSEFGSFNFYKWSSLQNNRNAMTKDGTIFIKCVIT